MITKEVSDYFGHGVRSRGAAYFREGRVRLDSIEQDGHFEAVVNGARLYIVSLRIDCDSRKWVVNADCTCPYVDSHDDFCKHIWAVILAIELNRTDELRSLGPPPRSVQMELLRDDEEGEFPADGDVEDWEEGADDFEPEDYDESFREAQEVIGDTVRRLDSAFPQSTRGRSTRRTRKAKPTPSWRKLLNGIPRDHRAMRPLRLQDESPIEPIFVLEVPDNPFAQAPVLSLARQRPTATGRPGKIKRLSLSPPDLERIRDPQDRRICMLLLGASDPVYSYYSGFRLEAGPSMSRFELAPPMQKELLPRISDTGRFMLRKKDSREPTPLTFDDAGRWEFVLLIDRPPGGQSHVLRGILRSGDERIELADVDCLVRGEPSLFVRDGKLHPFEDFRCFTWIANLGDPVPFEKDELPKLLRELKNLSTFPPIVCPPDWNMSEINELPPRPELALRLEDDVAMGRSIPASGDVTFRYGDAAVDAEDPGQFIVDESSNHLIRRQPEAEGRLLSRLHELGARADRYGEGLEVHHKKVPGLVSTLINEGWTVLGNRKQYRRPGVFHINVSSGIDWFDVDAEVDFDGQIAKAPELLAALNKGERFVTLGDGSFGMLPEAWLNRQKNWLALGQPADGKVRFKKNQIGLIDALLAEMPEATFDANLAAARRKLHRFNGIKPRKEPPGFRGTLRPYQREALGWLRFLEDFDWCGCLADDMGLGKTVQLLALLADKRRQRGQGPSLIVAPKSVVFNWEREAERFTPRLRAVNYTGPSRKDVRATLSDYDLVMTTYGTLRRDIRHLRDQSFNYVVLDEAQAIKNPTSQSAKAARLLQARRRLVLTGTPVENELGDLWSLFEFLNPGMLGTLDAFKGIAGTGRDNGSSEDFSLLRHTLRPFILRRTKSQVATDLPERSEQTIYCDLPPKQSACYRELRDHYRASLLARVDTDGMARSKMHVLEALLRLRQAACHPELIDQSKSGAESGKLDVLREMVTELFEEGHKVLVFSQFTKLLAIVRRGFDAQGVGYAYLDGQTRDRAQCVDRFQNDPDCRLFLISLKAGGTGLNLTAADYVFILDPWWNPAVEAQAIDRAHRIGQCKKVIAYRLIARDTIESKILELQQSKRELSEAIITQQNSLIRTLTRDDLSALLT